jgi:hypothetical protein
VATGTREVEVPCSDWYLRQPLTVQVLCIADAALGVVFVLNALGDLRDWLAWLRQKRNSAGSTAVE